MSIIDMKQRNKTNSPKLRQKSTYSKGSPPMTQEPQPGKFGDQNRPDEGVQEIIAENDQESADDDEYRESIDLQLYNENNGASGADMFS